MNMSILPPMNHWNKSQNSDRIFGSEISGYAWLEIEFMGFSRKARRMIDDTKMWGSNLVSDLTHRFGIAKTTYLENWKCNSLRVCLSVHQGTNWKLFFHRKFRVWIWTLGASGYWKTFCKRWKNAPFSYITWCSIQSTIQKSSWLLNPCSCLIEIQSFFHRYQTISC